MAGAELVSLHHRPDLLEQAAILLNNQWPRSLEARSVNLVESSKKLIIFWIQETFNRRES